MTNCATKYKTVSQLEIRFFVEIGYVRGFHLMTFINNLIDVTCKEGSLIQSLNMVFFYLTVYSLHYTIMPVIIFKY